MQLLKQIGMHYESVHNVDGASEAAVTLLLRQVFDIRSDSVEPCLPQQLAAFPW